MNNCDNKNKVKGFSLVEVIIALTIMAILCTFFAPSFTSYIDEAYRSKASMECSFVITAAQSEITSLYAQGKLKTVLDKGGFTITDSNKIKRVKKLDTFKEIMALAETGGTIQELWVDEDAVKIVGLAYLTQDAQYYIIHAPLAEGDKNYIYSVEEESDEYRKQLEAFTSSKWK